MTFYPANVLATRFRTRSFLVLMVLVIWVAATLVIFFKVVIPSFERGNTSETFAVDSTVYTYFADSLREGRYDPWVISSLAIFPNTLWAPVLIALILNSALLIMLLNYTLFVVSVLLYKRSYSISPSVFVLLLLLNPTTTTSILCVNKEILDFFSLSLFLYSRKEHRYILLLCALGIAFLNRYEISVVMLVYAIAESRLNPWREKRIVTLLSLIGLLNFVMPLWGARTLSHRFEEAQSAGLVKVLDLMQMHYLYALAVFPKIAEDMYGFLTNLSVWADPSSWLFIMFFNNLATAVLTVIIVKKRQLTLRNDFIYFAALGAVVVAQAQIVQPRYFYFVYVLLCLQVASQNSSVPSLSFSSGSHKEIVHA
jgi:hypothetical protein